MNTSTITSNELHTSVLRLLAAFKLTNTYPLMTRASWTTPEQHQWLKAHLPEWSKAQAANVTKSFHNKILTEWHKVFPLGTPTVEELAKADGNQPQAERAKRKAMNNVRYC